MYYIKLLIRLFCYIFIGLMIIEFIKYFFTAIIYTIGTLFIIGIFYSIIEWAFEDD